MINDRNGSTRAVRSPFRRTTARRLDGGSPKIGRWSGPRPRPVGLNQTATSTHASILATNWVSNACENNGVSPISSETKGSGVPSRACHLGADVDVARLLHIARARRRRAHKKGENAEAGQRPTGLSRLLGSAA